MNLQPGPHVTSWKQRENQKPNTNNDLEDHLDSLQWESEKFKMTPDLLQWKVQSEHNSEFESDSDSENHSDSYSENHEPLLELYSE